MNFHVMPRGVQFSFDFQDDEQDAAQVEIQGKKILNTKRLFENRMGEEGLISREEGRQILVKQGILDPVFAEADEVTLQDIAAKTWAGFEMAQKSHYLGIAPAMEMPEELVKLDGKGNVIDLVLRPKGLKAHDVTRVNHKCPICGHAQADRYNDHAGLMVCANSDCGCTFDPKLE